MEWSICNKHKKKEKTIQRVMPNACVCMNRYCPNSFTIMCTACKPEHRDHSIKILTLEDVQNFLHKLLKSPQNSNTKYITESINLMKKIKYMKDVRKKIDYLEAQIIKQTGNLIETTQILMNQYAGCKESAQQLQRKFKQLGNVQNFQAFKAATKECLSQLDYNFKKDRIELGNLVIKQKQDKRRKLIESTRRKIQEVRDYSMKIIEVILAQDDDTESDEQDQFQDMVNQKRNFYKKLKEQLGLERRDKQILKEKQQEDEERDQQRSKSTTFSNNVKKFYQSSDWQTQTCDQWIVDMREEIVTLKHNLDQARHQTQKQVRQVRDQIQTLTKQKAVLRKQVDSTKQKLLEQRQYLKAFSKRMKAHIQSRKRADQMKQEVYQKMIQVQSK